MTKRVSLAFEKGRGGGEIPHTATCRHYHAVVYHVLQMEVFMAAGCCLQHVYQGIHIYIYIYTCAVLLAVVHSYMEIFVECSVVMTWSVVKRYPQYMKTREKAET